MGLEPPRSEDDVAIERYRYLLRTAPPETIERVHAEAFAKLTEPQRQQVLADLSAVLPAHEQPRSTDARAMARAATRAEYTNPGFMERTLGSQGPASASREFGAEPHQGQGGPSFGSMLGSSILGTVVGYVIGSALVGSFLAPGTADDQGYEDGSTDASADGSADAGTGDGWGDSGSGWGGDTGGADAGADIGGFGEFGGDFGF